MRIPPGIRRAFRLPLTTERIARELDDEVRFHVEMRAKSLEALGLPRNQAYAEALRKFGDVEDLRDYCVSMEAAHMHRAKTRERFDSVLQDLRVGSRQLRRTPAVAAIIVLTLALGIGSATAIFSVVNGVVLQPLPFARPEQIVQLWSLDSKGARHRFADATFDYLAASNHSFSALAEFSAWEQSIARDADASRAVAAPVTRQFFDVLGVKPLLGRLFIPEEHQLGAPMVVVISHRLWTTQFGGSPSALGASLTIGRARATVVGILPAGKEFPANADIWYPRERTPKNTGYTALNWGLLGRLRDGVTPAGADREVSMLLQRLHTAVGDETWTVDGVAVGLRDQIVGNVALLLLLVLGASGLLLVIACANVANLLIARLAAREGEIAVRVALGAGRARLAQQLLVETSLLAALGCIGGVLLAAASVQTLIALRPAMIPRVGELRLDWHVLAFAISLSAGTALALGLLTAWRATRGNIREGLSQSQRTVGASGATYRIRGALVVVQLATTVVLLIGAGLLAHSFERLVTIDPGFRDHGVVVSDIAFAMDTGRAGIARRAQLVDELVSRARTVPGVTAAGFSNAEPFSGGSSNGGFLKLPNANVKLGFDELIDRILHDKANTGWANYRLTSDGYFKALGIPLLSGRLFDDGDRVETPHVAVVSASLAKKEWPNENAIGKVIDFGNIDSDPTPMTIVGVVGDTREEDLGAGPSLVVYCSYRQRRGNDDGVYLVLSSNTEAATIQSARQTFRALRPDLPVRFQTVEQIVGLSIASQRFMLLLISVFGGAALVLATLGIYSVISFLVAQRGREISLRVALGASAGEIVRLVLRQGIALSVVGIAIGLAMALGATHVLQNLLYQVGTTDPLTFAVVLVVASVVVLVASYIPARRAARLDPMDVLRGG